MGAADSRVEFAYAQGSPQFVGSYLGAVTAASAIGAHNRGQGAYNACMEANGFVEADKLSPANPRVAQVKEILEQAKACRQGINNSPIYATLGPYHPVDGKYTPAQLANTAEPTLAQVGHHLKKEHANSIPYGIEGVLSTTRAAVGGQAAGCGPAGGSSWMLGGRATPTA